MIEIPPLELKIPPSTEGSISKGDACATFTIDRHCNIGILVGRLLTSRLNTFLFTVLFVSLLVQFFVLNNIGNEYYVPHWVLELLVSLKCVSIVTIQLMVSSYFS